MKRSASNTNEEFSLKEKILYTLGSIVVLGGGFFLGRKLILKTLANSEEKRSFEDGSWATWAKQLKMAFDNDGWWGTNTTEVRRIVQEIPSKDDFNKVVKSYKKLYNRNLMFDLSDELQSTEYNEMLQIVASKPNRLIEGQAPVYNYSAWAKRLKAAFDKTYGFLPATDEEAIKAVFQEIPTQTAFVEVGKAYSMEYGANLIEDLKSELEFWEYDEYMAIITSKPKI